MYASPYTPLDIPKCNILSYLFPPNTTPSERPIWIDAENTSNAISPAQMLLLVKRFALGLQLLGIAEQEAIMVFSSNHIYTPLVYLAAAGSKRCFTGASPASTAREVAQQMRSIQPAIVLVHNSLLETGVTAAKQADIPLDRLFVFSDKAHVSTSTSGPRDWRTILAPEDKAASWQWDNLNGELSSTTVAVINFSSGTTGVPKGVCITHQNLVANTAQTIFSQYRGAPTSPERWLAFLPLYHAYSQLFTINIACKLQVPVYIMPKFTFDGFLGHIQRFKITALQLVPPILVMMAKRPETAKYDLSSVEHVLSGAAPLSTDLQNEIMARFNLVVSQGFGMSETTCTAFTSPRMSKDLTGSIGYLLPNTEARLVDEYGAEIHGEDKPGELYLRGPQIMLGYWKNDFATQETTEPGGWLKTGDVAVTKEGRWWIVDRKKELIKVNGLQVAPAELEAVLLEHQDVADAAVVGIVVHGEELPRAYVVLQSNSKGKPTSQDLQEFVAQKVAKHKRLAGGIRFIEEVPKLASGKILRKIVREWAKADVREVESITKSRL
ncbi:putative NRPS-like protein biosynthetic cluster [Elasticomyces elasticus]|uniref:NRPS-like protein biosynthetic cluster n=1 Tax=Elasticomyces elasticus TaxID=574655 RepID=A0AAN7VUW3_9PEZI|nr:putative NRPS-like protein biosynthetic cluster [Elasticomyces elasticus]